jgi:hypothetical protein
VRIENRLHAPPQAPEGGWHHPRARFHQDRGPLPYGRSLSLEVRTSCAEDAACKVTHMSTRGCIARLERKAPMEFTGVYHHWDSYPSGLGQALFQIRNRDFGKDTEAMLRELIDQHPAGWSTVVGRRFDQGTGWGKRPKRGKHAQPGDTSPQCYCHGGRQEPGWLVTQANASGIGVEYVYAFDGSMMLILASYCRDGAKMVGMFGAGDPDAVWSVIATVDMNGPEPDWQALEMTALQH